MGSKGKYVLFVVISLLLLSLVYGFTASQLNIQSSDRIARIFDVTNDGIKDILTFSDSIDPNLRDIALYQRYPELTIYQITPSNQSFTKTQTLAQSRKRCSMDYGDFSGNGNIDLFFACLNETDEIAFDFFSFDGNSFVVNTSLPSLTPISHSASFYGDSLMLDFTNDGTLEILSCYVNTSGNLGLITKDAVLDSGISLSDFNTQTCFLEALDVNGNGFFDIITYTYDAEGFNLYLNTNATPLFQKADPSIYFNASFFENTKIKSLKAIDSNQTGFSDVHYIIDLGQDPVTNNHNISFGYLENLRKRIFYEPIITTPEISSEFLWGNYYLTTNNIPIQNEGEDVFYFNVSSVLITNITQTTNLFYNLNVTHNNQMLISPENDINSYEQTKFGNFLNRNAASFGIGARCIDVSGQAIAPSGLESSWSSVNQIPTTLTFINESGDVFTQSIEVCNGFDSNCDGIIDGPFDFTWPDGHVQRISFKNNAGNFVNRTFTRTSALGQMYEITFSCQPRRDNGFDLNVGTISGGNTQPSGSATSGSVTVAPITRDDDISTEEISSQPQDSSDDSTPESSTSASTDAPSTTQLSREFLGNATRSGIRVERSFQYVGGRTQVTEIVRNVNYFTEEDVRIRLRIPRSIASDVSQISGNFNVIRANPIIEFEVGNLRTFEQRTLQYSFNRRISPEDLALIYTEIYSTEIDEEALRQREQEFIDQIQRTSEVVRVREDIQVIGNQTIFTIDLELDANTALSNFSVYQEIPKCLIEIINDLVAESKNNQRFEIVEEDPIIVWHFDKLVDASQIQLSINAVADQDCLDQARTISVARNIVIATSDIDMKNVWFAILFIPLLALLLIAIGELAHIKSHEDEKIHALIHRVKKYYHHKFSKPQIYEKLLNEGYSPHEIEQALSLNAKTKLHHITQKLNVGIHEAILVLLIVLNVLDFFHVLPEDVDYFKKVVSWIILGVVLYRVSISNIIVGVRHKVVDLILILSFFLLTLKNLTGYAKSVLSTIHFSELDFFVFDLYTYIVRHNHIFERNFFYVGIIGIILSSIYLGFKLPVGPCVMNWVHEKYVIQRIVSIHFVLLGFFIVIFNLMFEWLAIAVDAFILVSTILFVLFIAIKHRHKVKPAKLIEEVAIDAEVFYEKFIELLHYKKFLPLAVSGMLILFVLTEIANYIIPYLTGLFDVIYFGSFQNTAFDVGRMPFFNLGDFFNPEASLFAKQSAFASIPFALAIATTYVLNIVAILFLLFTPAIIWYHRFKQRQLPIDQNRNYVTKHWFNVFFFSSLVVYILRPAFTFDIIRTTSTATVAQRIVGVDIGTQAIILDGLYVILFFAFLVGLLVHVLHKHKYVWTDFALLISFSFFSYYTYLFLLAQIELYKGLIAMGGILGLYFLFFAILLFSLLYFVGYVNMIYLYLPKFLKLKLINTKLFKHQHLHHVKHRNKVTDSVATITEYIEKSLHSHHELFIIVEHLEELGYSIEDIEEGIKQVIPHYTHEDHFHHKQRVIKELHKYMMDKDLKTVIDEILSLKFTEKEVLYALALPRTFNLIADSKEKVLVLEKKGYPLDVVRQFLPSGFVHPLLKILIKQDIKVSEQIDYLTAFRFTEEDVRLAAHGFHPHDKKDKEILRYLDF